MYLARYGGLWPIGPEPMWGCVNLRKLSELQTDPLVYRSLFLYLCMQRSARMTGSAIKADI